MLQRGSQTQLVVAKFTQQFNFTYFITMHRSTDCAYNINNQLEGPLFIVILIKFDRSPRYNRAIFLEFNMAELGFNRKYVDQVTDQM